MADSTAKSREDSLRLTRVLAEHGSASTLDVRQAEQLVYTATATIADLERQRGQHENALSVLLGENPHDIPRGRPLMEQLDLPGAPPGLPSQLLERRPDIRQAEQQLAAANAQIGVAKSAFFPSISLTGTAGGQSFALNQLVNSSAEMWNGAASLTQPIFQGGALRGGLKLAKAQREEMLLTYQQTILNAFRQVSDSLIALQKGTEFRKQQQLLTDAARDADQLSHVLFEHGGASYLQVLTSETNYFAAELDLASAQLNERLALVQLYNALGGGWNE
jgi:outer membrane protein, multidrug efflux system